MCGHRARTKDALKQHKGRDHRGPGGGQRPRLEPEELPKDIVEMRVLHSYAVGARPLIGCAPLAEAVVQVELRAKFEQHKVLYARYDEIKARFPQELAHYWVKSLSMSLTKAIKKHENFKKFEVRPQGRHR